MKTIKSRFLLFSLCILFLCSSKCKDKFTLNLIKEELPAITQTGANTFGFLLNGDVWLPKAALLQQKLDLSYDPNYKGGTLNIIAKRYLSSTDMMELSIGLIGVDKPGKYDFSNNGVIYRDQKSSCYYFDNRIVSGSITITKIDLTKFISGTFEFKLEKQSCSIINATQGRFDLKIE
ncbi:hypothetical protein EZ428_00835 [Pedobacter frigiditerrae]|uniref:Uncharacterized protein n=1 Tax=Pedobacter frigiditerrae TaxID=2530452 RepID=A0A4R0N0T8_9SPHI|nr:DUF6252 family protein [Pedobacter frigiditerrae]TCC93349.1 hypothetical protein EZ428_00835 [Pedobacter frigiditerrae]